MKSAPLSTVQNYVDGGSDCVAGTMHVLPLPAALHPQSAPKHTQHLLTLWALQDFAFKRSRLRLCVRLTGISIGGSGLAACLASSPIGLNNSLQPGRGSERQRFVNVDV